MTATLLMKQARYQSAENFPREKRIQHASLFQQQYSVEKTMLQNSYFWASNRLMYCNDLTSLIVSMGGGGSLFLQRFTITHVTFLRKLICGVQEHQGMATVHNYN